MVYALLLWATRPRASSNVGNAQNMARTEWRAKEFTPGSDSAIHIDTPFSRLLDKPLIMVAGMAPTTSSRVCSASTRGPFIRHVGKVL